MEYIMGDETDTKQPESLEEKANKQNAWNSRYRQDPTYRILKGYAECQEKVIQSIKYIKGSACDLSALPNAFDFKITGEESELINSVLAGVLPYDAELSYPVRVKIQLGGEDSYYRIEYVLPLSTIRIVAVCIALCSVTFYSNRNLMFDHTNEKIQRILEGREQQRFYSKEKTPLAGRIYDNMLEIAADLLLNSDMEYAKVGRYYRRSRIEDRELLDHNFVAYIGASRGLTVEKYASVIDLRKCSEDKLKLYPLKSYSESPVTEWHFKEQINPDYVSRITSEKLKLEIEKSKYASFDKEGLSKKSKSEQLLISLELMESVGAVLENAKRELKREDFVNASTICDMEYYSLAISDAIEVVTDESARRRLSVLKSQLDETLHNIPTSKIKEAYMSKHRVRYNRHYKTGGSLDKVDVNRDWTPSLYSKYNGFFSKKSGQVPSMMIGAADDALYIITGKPLILAICIWVLIMSLCALSWISQATPDIPWGGMLITLLIGGPLIFSVVLALATVCILISAILTQEKYDRCQNKVGAHIMLYGAGYVESRRAANNFAEVCNRCEMELQMIIHMTQCSTKFYVLLAKTLQKLRIRGNYRRYLREVAKVDRIFVSLISRGPLALYERTDLFNGLEILETCEYTEDIFNWSPYSWRPELSWVADGLPKEKLDYRQRDEMRA